MVYCAYSDRGVDELMILLIVIVIVSLIAQFSLIGKIEENKYDKNNG